MKFSIIIPVYNCEQYLIQAIESVLKQTYEEWELILVDDGSTDKSGAICEQYVSDKRIKVLHTENSGELISRINGMKIATGDYVLGCDADDYLEENCLEIVEAAIRKTNSDVVIYQYGICGKQREVAEWSVLSFETISMQDNILAIIKDTNHCLWNKAIKNTAVQAGIKEVPLQRFDVCADYVLTLAILAHTKNAYYIDNILYNYRILESSMSHNVNLKHLIDIETSAQIVFQLLKNYQILNSDIEKAIYISYLKGFLWRYDRLRMSNEIKKSEIQAIREMEEYCNSKKYEKISNFPLAFFLLLKIYRYNIKPAIWIKKCIIRMRDRK